MHLSLDAPILSCYMERTHPLVDEQPVDINLECSAIAVVISVDPSKQQWATFAGQEPTNS